MLKIVFKAKERRSLALMCVMDLVDKSLAKKNEPIPLNENKQPVMTLLEKNKENEKYIKAIAFSVKAVEEMLLSIAKDQEQMNCIMVVLGVDPRSFKREKTQAVKMLVSEIY